MEKLEDFYVEGGSNGDGIFQFGASFKGSDVVSNYSVLYERFVEETDSLFEDLDGRLTISRMVSDSVIKGMVKAVAEEAAEKIGAKEAEIAHLREKLRLRELKLSMFEMGLHHNDKKFESLPMHIQPETVRFKVEQDQNHFEDCISSLKIEAGKQFQRIKQGIEDGKVYVQCLNGISANSKKLGSTLGVESQSVEALNGSSEIDMGFQLNKITEKLVVMDEDLDTLKNILSSVYKQIGDMFFLCETTVSDQRFEWKFQEEIGTAVFSSSIKNFQKQFEAKLEEQRWQFLGSINKSWLKRIDEISKLRQELDVISKSLLGPEPGQLISHGSHESFEEATNTRKKENPQRKILGNYVSSSASLREGNGTLENSAEIAESALLRHMSKDELISYFRTKITDLKRNNESKVLELTEDYFSLQRKTLKEKGSSPFRKEKEFDAIRKRVPAIIMKLDSIIQENNKLLLNYNDYENVCSLKDRLLSENQLLRDFLREKNKEVNSLSSQVSDSVNKMTRHSLTEANFLKQINKLKSDLEDSKIEFLIREDIYMLFFPNLIGEIKCDIGDSDIEALFVQEIFGIIYREALRGAEVAVDLAMAEYGREKERRIFLEAKLLENEQNLLSEIGEKERTKEEVVSILKLLEEKEKCVLEIGIALRQQNEKFQLVSLQLKGQTDWKEQQERLLFEKNMEFNLVKGRLDEASQKIVLYEEERGELDQRLKLAADDLREANEKKSILDAIILEKQQIISSNAAYEREQRQRVQSVMLFVQDLSKGLSSLECQVAENVGLNNSRLEMADHQLKPLIQQVELLRKKRLLYERAFLSRCADLVKAEKEVDLLADEVDTLLNLLEKIYITLDHYSPILQHYPGVMDILKLVKRELKGESRSA